MIIVQDELFRKQAERYRLRWNCESCGRFNGTERCAHGFPTERHREARYEDPSADVYFCKEHELA